MEQHALTSDSSNVSKRKPWIRRHPILTAFSFLILSMVAAVFLYFMLRPYYSTFDRSEQGELAYTMPSPNGEYVAEMYGVPYGGAAGGVTIWVDVKKIVASDMFIVKTIYRAKYHGANHLEWKNENTLRIENRNEYSDDSITLNIDDEIYDSWGWACRSLRMKDQYVRCLAPEK
ncbi:DUF5412 family protein [Paenibacillus sp. 11B]|uniref:DUF5412 family protein n=1 Tax=unclassified Paenibacillus TaxID=185978 RepID=UPI00264E7005|nr:DUF5412 family protein [Paenibacillus sp. 11B]MDN8590102.1 DUF5412 family protein [Paenibacillus sp. 11B]